MATVDFKIVVTDPQKVIENRIKRAIADKINISMQAVIKKIRADIAKVIDDAIETCQEVKSLRGGLLQAELGVPSDKVEEIIKYIKTALVTSMVITYTPMPLHVGRLSGRITLKLLPSDFIDNVINANGGSYTTDKGQVIPWLQWLLTLGDKVIVRDFQIDYFNTAKSRTGLAVIRKFKGRSWRVPPQFSGVKTDNMITRAIDDVSNYIAYVFEKDVRQAI